MMQAAFASRGGAQSSRPRGRGNRRPVRRQQQSQREGYPSRTDGTPAEFPQKVATLAPPAPGVFRIIPIGGCEEVGRNMTVFEYGDDIVILDMGVQFPEEDMPGIDFIIPNARYLKGKE